MSKQPHLCVEPGQIADRVIVCGDPDRTRRIAALCESEEFLSSHREYTLINVRFRGVPITLCSTGIGAPSLLIALEELRQCGVRSIIRVGSAGALQKHIRLGDLIVAEGAVRDEGGSLAYLPLSYPAVADHELVNGLLRIAAQSGSVCHTGLVRSHDSFYTDEEESLCRLWSRRGLLGADMETAPLLAVGRFRGLKVASILNNVVLFEHDVQEGVSQYVSADSRMQEGEKQAALAALSTLARL